MLLPGSGEGHSPPVYRFGAFELDMARGVLLRVGVEIPLRRKSWELLVYLVTHPERLVTKEELMDAIWVPAVVTDGALTQCVVDVRRALDDHDHQIVRTVPRRGYRFEAPEIPAAHPAALAQSAPPSDPKPQQTGTLYRALLGALLLGAVPLIWWAVMAWRTFEPTVSAIDIAAEPNGGSAPRVLVGNFSVSGEDPQLSHFASRAQAAVIADLTAIRSLDVAELARAGTGDFELEGMVEDTGLQIRTSVQVSLSKGEVLWAQSFEQPLDRADFEQAELVARVVEGVVRTHRIAASIPPSVAAEARREFAQGHLEWWLWALGAGGNVRVAGDHWRRAIALEPRFWPAHVQLVIHYSNRFELDRPLPDYIGDAHRAARELMALTAYDAEYPVPVAWEFPVAMVLKRLDLDYDYAERLLHTAKARGFPAGQIDTELGRLYALRGEQTSATARFQAALDRGAEINHASALKDLGMLLLAAGQYERAREVYDRASSFTTPGSEMHLYIQMFRIVAHHYAGDTAHAEAILDETIAAYGHTHARLLPHALALLGRHDAARAILPEVEALYQSQRLSMALTTLLAHFFLGDLDATFLWLERAIEIRDRNAIALLRTAPFLKPLRMDARYAPAMARVSALQAHGSPLRADIETLLDR